MRDVPVERSGALAGQRVLLVHDRNCPLQLTEPAPVFGYETGAVEAEMGRLDPQADLALDLGCGACDHRWQATFDIAAFL